ncbi:MAG: hypothetical protein IPO22_14505 [Anaerolineales bacterium]|nr:hypothetical protein [Anaerolineales bacterium]
MPTSAITGRFHGIYIFGLSLIFLAGVMLIIALWPWNKEYYVTMISMPHQKRIRPRTWSLRHRSHHCAFFIIRRSSWLILWSGFETFLAENIIRYPEKTTMEYSIIGHLLLCSLSLPL